MPPRFGVAASSGGLRYARLGQVLISTERAALFGQYHCMATGRVRALSELRMRNWAGGPGRRSLHESSASAKFVRKPRCYGSSSRHQATLQRLFWPARHHVHTKHAMLVEQDDLPAKTIDSAAMLDRAPLVFQIPVASTAGPTRSANSGIPKYWTHALYQGPKSRLIKVHYCKSKATTEKIASEHFLGSPVLGFDIEFAPYSSDKHGRKANVSLIQLACEDRILLSHIAMFAGQSEEDLVAPTLKQILEDKDIIKTGVAIRGDCTRLKKWLGIEARGVLELSHFHNLIKYSNDQPDKVSKKTVSLAAQVAEHLGLPLSKGKVRNSDWSRPLNYEQCHYAAADAYAGFRLEDILERKRLALDAVPPRPPLVEDDIPILPITWKQTLSERKSGNLETGNQDSVKGSTVECKEVSDHGSNPAEVDMSSDP